MEDSDENSHLFLFFSVIKSILHLLMYICIQSHLQEDNNTAILLLSSICSMYIILLIFGWKRFFLSVYICVCVSDTVVQFTHRLFVL